MNLCLVQILSIENNKLFFQNYWSCNRKLNSTKKITDFKEELYFLLNDSVKLQLRSDVSVGSHLSGGIDLSIISLLASEQLNSRLNTFSGGFNEGDDYDEIFYAKLVSKKGKTFHNIIYPSQSDFVDSISKIIWHMDYPQLVQVFFLNFFCQS